MVVIVSEKLKIQEQLVLVNMAHYALLNNDNFVTAVISGADEIYFYNGNKKNVMINNEMQYNSLL